MRCDQCGKEIPRNEHMQVTRSVADGPPSRMGQRTHNETLTLCQNCYQKRGKTLWFVVGAIVVFFASLLLIAILDK